jgi:transcriptional regulator with XRE-family HTH domain
LLQDGLGADRIRIVVAALANPPGGGNNGDKTRSESPIALSQWNSAAGIWLREVRKRMGWTQSELAHLITVQLKTEITEGVVYFWERGDRTIPAVAIMVVMALVRDAGVDLWREPKLRKITARQEQELLRRLRPRGK